jgi:hypothetical protein
MWSSGQSSCLQIQRSGFDFQRYQIFWEVVSLEWGPLSFVNKIEELLERKSSGSGLANREYGRKDPLCWPRNTLYPKTLALTSPTSSGRSVGIVRSGAEATEFHFDTSTKMSSRTPGWRPLVYKMLYLLRLITLWACTAWYIQRFIFPSVPFNSLCHSVTAVNSHTCLSCPCSCVIVLQP